MFLRQIFDPHLSQYAYLIGCQKTGEAIDIDASELVGLQCETTLIVENYNGNDGNKIGSYLSESDEF